MTAESNKEALVQARKQLNQLIETEIELGIMVHDFQATIEAKDTLVSRMNVYVSQLGELSNLSSELKEQIPLDVVEYIENGRNPDVYTREFAELLAKQNQFVNGKMKAMGDFRDILATQIKEAYPDLTDIVDRVVEKTKH